MKKWFISLFIISFIIGFILISGVSGKTEKKDTNKCNKAVTPTIIFESTPTAGVSATITPENTGGPGKEPENPHTSTTEPPAAVTCNIPFSQPLLTDFHADGNGSVTFKWFNGELDIDKFAIVYGYSPDLLIYGQDNIDRNAKEVQLNLLQPGENVFAQLWSFKGGCAEKSNVLDPVIK